jgi:hypothetical protein
LHNEGASKGILVTTSGYGKAAYEFAALPWAAARPYSRAGMGVLAQHQADMIEGMSVRSWQILFVRRSP